MIKKLILAATLWLLASVPAFAQCNGLFQPNTFCGNVGASPGLPKATPLTTITGTITPPGATVMGDIATWGNSTGTVLNDTSPINYVTNSFLAQMLPNTVKCNPTGSTANAQDCSSITLAPPSTVTPTTDGAQVTVQNSSKTAASIYQPISVAGLFFWDTVRSVSDSEPGTTVQNLNAFGAYLFTGVAQGSLPNAKNSVGLFVDGVIAVNNGAQWGVNTSCGDNTTNGLATLSGRQCIGYEGDFTINGASTVEGVSLILQGPGTVVSANAVQVAIAGSSTAKWVNGFITNDGAVTSRALSIGASATSGANTPGQQSVFAYFDGGGVERGMVLQANNAAFNITSTGNPDGFFMQTGTGNVTLGATGSSSNININLLPQSGGLVKFGNAASFSANGAVATAFTGVGPTGSHANIQEWLTVLDSAGTVRYIPAF